MQLIKIICITVFLCVLMVKLNIIKMFDRLKIVALMSQFMGWLIIAIWFVQQRKFIYLVSFHQPWSHFDRFVFFLFVHHSVSSLINLFNPFFFRFLNFLRMGTEGRL